MFPGRFGLGCYSLAVIWSDRQNAYETWSVNMRYASLGLWVNSMILNFTVILMYDQHDFEYCCSASDI